MNQYEELISLAGHRLAEQFDLSVIEEVFSPGYTAHAGRSVYKGHSFIRHYAKQLRSAIPDVHLTEIQFLSHSGETLTWQRTYRGTHRGGLKGILPSGKKVSWTEMVVTRFEGEKIAEEWVVSELAGELMEKQIHPLPGVETPGKG
jgi:predicted ester cyclase